MMRACVRLSHAFSILKPLSSLACHALHATSKQQIYLLASLKRGLIPRASLRRDLTSPQLSHARLVLPSQNGLLLSTAMRGHLVLADRSSQVCFCLRVGPGEAALDISRAGTISRAGVTTEPTSIPLGGGVPRTALRANVAHRVVGLRKPVSRKLRRAVASAAGMRFVNGSAIMLLVLHHSSAS